MVFVTRLDAPVTAVRPETELLLCCARTQVNAETGSRMKTLLAREIDWQYLVRSADRHALMPLLYHNLRAIGPTGIPEPVLDGLHRWFRENSRRNLFMVGELCKILRLLESHGIEAVPYKGPVLAACMYGNLALRQFVDLDIIVRRRDVFRASDVLQSVGYRPDFPLTRAQEAGYLRSRYAVELGRDDGYFAVELHWEVAPRYFAFPLDTERLWARLGQVSMYDTTIRTLAPEDLLLMLCVHGAKHLWEKLGWICDIAELVRTHRGMDWDRVAAQAHELRSERLLGLGLLLASDLLGADVPEPALGRARADQVVRALGVQVRDQLQRSAGPSHGNLEVRIFHVRLRERLRDKLWYCFRIVTTPNQAEWTLLRLPGPLSFGYRLVRPPRLLIQHGLGLLRKRS